MLTSVLPTSPSALITKFVIIILEGPPVFAVTIDMGTTAPYVSNNILGFKGLFGTYIFLVHKFLICGKTSQKSIIFREIQVVFFCNKQSIQKITRRYFISWERLGELYTRLLLMWLELGAIHVCALSLFLLTLRKPCLGVFFPECSHDREQQLISFSVQSSFSNVN